MATTKNRTTRRSTRARTTPSTSTNRTSSTSSTSTRKKSFASRTGKAISDRPVASAAIGTGLVAGIAAAVAGFFAFKKSGKTFSEFSGDVATSVKDKASGAGEFVKDGLADAKTKAKDLTGRRKDGLDAEPVATQADVAAEALTLKETGKQTKGKRPVDPVVESQTKVGAISY